MPQVGAKIPVGISACLLGEPVRYDGGHKFDSVIAEHLGDLMTFVPVCPEVAIGLGTPRPPIQLVATDAGIRVCRVGDASIDVTDRLLAFGTETAAGLPPVCGYIFKARSPSCGMGEVETHTETGGLIGNNGIGAFARAIIEALPELPVIDEDGLRDPALRDAFIRRVQGYSQSLAQA